MMQGNELAKWNVLEDLSNNSETYKINIFTSSSCSFCNEALEAVQEAAKKFNQLNLPIEVVETSVDEQPEVIEALNAIALPMILIGKSKIIGLPRAEDIEQVLHHTMLTGVF
jgi:glutaredoxin